MFDFLVVGAGFAGATVAERLAAHGRRVLVVDKRPHIAGNAYDSYDADGVLVHHYGPHIFHTNSKEVFDYLSAFTEWRPYAHRVLAQVDGQLVPIPINLDTINALYGTHLSADELEAFLAARREVRPEVRNSEDVVVSKVGRELFEKFYRGYTRKQWGREPRELDASVAGRVPVRTNRDPRYFTDAYQAMPRHGYTALFARMLQRPGISVLLQADFREVRHEVAYEHLVFTGPVDEYFDHCFGPLPYRSLRFVFESHAAERVQPVATINYPNDYDFTRVTEFKHITGQVHGRTVLVYEYPQAEGDPYYPVPAPEARQLYARYAELAERERRVTFVGRLGTYRYYNMDQVVAQALTTVRDRLL
jgi:UDP-galactopyranose mutase